MRTLLITLGVIAVAARDGAAQEPVGTVTGKITAADAGTPLAGATVFVTGTQMGAIVRSDGSYRITLRPGNYELRVRFIGWVGMHDSVVVTSGQTTSKDFALTRSPATLEALAIVGTRGEARTVTESPVPIDVLTASEIVSTGRTETNQILQMLAPSFNFPRPSISDGSDHVRPATLRGLGPDQVLVLVNGKRRHNSALVNVNGTVGRGSTGVDLNAIPASMIDRIEVLRDGAAAQYGSDAIAGVINVVLKGSAPGEASGTFGQTAEGDGQVAHLAANAGSVFGQSNYFHAGLEYRNRGFTNRAGIDPRNQYFANDPRNNQPKRVTLRLGDAATKDVLGMFNGSYTTQRGIELYAFGGASNRDGESAANWRLPNGNNTVRALWPDGFLPLINTEIWDLSASAGAKGLAAGWQWDLSTTFGRNSLQYDVSQSNNASMGLSSPTDFDAGQLRFAQSTTNLDLFRTVGLGGLSVRTAAGAEFRLDKYEIVAGEDASWIDGKQRILDGPNANSSTTLPAPGAQGFPGFRPADEQNETRNNYAVYVDLESDLTSQLLLGLAGRFEDYSDFGSTTTGKLTARFAITPQVALRGAVNTGFRAPSLGQSFFSSTATNLVAGQFLEIRTFPVSSAGAKALGAKPLKPEKSVNASFGVTFDPTSQFSLSVDYYDIKINDRIVFSENFIGAAIQSRLAAIGLTGITGARYFTNAIDTHTRGVDVVANYGLDFGRSGGVLRFTGGYNHNKNEVTNVIPTPPELTGFSEQLFGRAERGRIEEAQPRDNILLSANYSRGVLGGVVRAQRFGEVTNRQIRVATNQPSDQTFSAKWITDVSGSYRLLNRVTFALGADNVFDIYPDVQDDQWNVATGFAGNSNFGMNPYSGISPFGFNGRFFWAKLSYGF
ncbi:MAG TPA: TonB-dependent receptor [Gemmatimonadaceae bacterium]|nr:TonB-dependent receptor [Gemmatimonadaceae bacterium]